MMSKIAAALGMTGLLMLAAAACAPADDGDAVDQATQNATEKVKGVTKDERKGYLASAQIWSEADFAQLGSKDLLTGPTGKGSFPAVRNADGSAEFPSITCEFVEPTRVNELGGKSPKFQCGKCTTGKGCNVDKTLKVKFGKDADANGEVYAEVMATRLFWALGFKTDDVYPVRVTCKNCPEDPWAVYSKFAPGTGERAERVYTAALIERKYEGTKIEEANWPEDKDGQGFAFDDVEKERAKAPNRGAPNAEWSALKLLAAFMQHSDNKAANQRLVCAPGAVTQDAKCSAPFLMIQDTGATFGGGGQILGTTGSDSKARFDEWTSKKVWKDRGACQAALFSFFYSNPTVSEEGRQLLVRILSKITDQHLRDVFTASRIVERGELVKENGQKRAVTVEDWVKTFNEKRAELAQPCGG